MSSTMGPRDDGTATASGFVPSIALAPPSGATSHRDQRNPMRSRLFDSGLCRVKQRQHADIVAALKGDRDIGLAQHLHGSARQLEVFAVHDVEDLGEA
jgi:hypothetical protein